MIAFSSTNTVVAFVLIGFLLLSGLEISDAKSETKRKDAKKSAKKGTKDHSGSSSGSEETEEMNLFYGQNEDESVETDSSDTVYVEVENSRKGRVFRPVKISDHGRAFDWAKYDLNVDPSSLAASAGSSNQNQNNQNNNQNRNDQNQNNWNNQNNRNDQNQNNQNNWNNQNNQNNQNSPNNRNDQSQNNWNDQNSQNNNQNNQNQNQNTRNDPGPNNPNTQNPSIQNSNPNSDDNVCGTTDPVNDQACISIKLPWKADPIYFCTPKENLDVKECLIEDSADTCFDDERNDSLKIATPWDCCPHISTPNTCASIQCPPPPFNRTCKAVKKKGDCCDTYYCDKEDPVACKLLLPKKTCTEPPQGKENCTRFRDPYGCCTKFQCDYEERPGYCPRKSLSVKMVTKMAVNSEGKQIALLVPETSVSAATDINCIGDNFCPADQKCCSSTGPVNKLRGEDENSKKRRLLNGVCKTPVFQEEESEPQGRMFKTRKNGHAGRSFKQHGHHDSSITIHPIGGQESMDAISTSGRSMAGRTAFGRSMNGLSASGRSMAGRSTSGRSMTGRSARGRSMAGRSFFGRSLANPFTKRRSASGRSSRG